MFVSDTDFAKAAKVAHGLNIDAYLWCLSFAKSLNLTPSSVGINTNDHIVNSQLFFNQCFLAIQNNDYLDNYTKRIYKRDLYALQELLMLNARYDHNKNNPEHGRSTLSPKNIKRRTLLKFMSATLGSIISLGTYTHIWPGAKTENMGVGNVSALTGLGSSTIRWGLGAGLTAFLAVSAPWALGLYLPFCVFRVFYKEWEPITDSEYKNHYGEAAYALYKISYIKKMFSPALNNEYINQRNKIPGFSIRNELDKERLQTRQLIKNAFINMFSTFVAPIRTFRDERKRKEQHANIEKDFAYKLAKVELPKSPPHLDEIKVDEEVVLMWEEIYSNCIAFAQGLGVGPDKLHELYIDEANKTIDKAKFEIACERRIKNAKLNPIDNILVNSDLKILLERMHSCAEYSISKNQPDYGKSELPAQLIYAKAAMRMTLACISSIISAGGVTNNYPGAKKQKERMGELGVGIKLYGAAKGFLIGVGVLTVGVTSPPLLAVGIIYAISVAFNNEWQPIKDKVYQDFNGIAALSKLRNQRLAEQLSPALQKRSALVLANMDEQKAKVTDVVIKTTFYKNMLTAMNNFVQKNFSSSSNIPYKSVEKHNTTQKNNHKNSKPPRN